MQAEGGPSGVPFEPVPPLGRLPFPSRPLLSSSLFQANGQHLSTGALALDSLAANGACGPPAPQVSCGLSDSCDQWFLSWRLRPAVAR